jgi:hypothetical protein
LESALARLRTPVLGALIALPTLAWAGQVHPTPELNVLPTHVRPATDAVAAVLKGALAQSATLRELATTIEASDVLVFVVISNEPSSWRGGTRFASTFVDGRMVIVTINADLDVRERLAVLGHELQHVCEVAADPDVTDQAGMRRLFERVGHQEGLNAGVYETDAAQRIERQVRSELTQY